MHPAPTQDEELHWLAMRMTPGLGTRKAAQLIEVFRTPQAIFRASKSELESVGLSPAVAQSVASGCAFEEAVDQQNKLNASGAVLIPLTDPRYPPRLKEIYDPPPMLFSRGRVELLSTLMIGVVGTRRPTSYGTAATQRLARDLAVAGLTITSGMAVASIRRPTRLPWRLPGTRSRCLGAAWMSFIRSKTVSWRNR